ncbi:MAG TPA: magnesium transporter [Fimbriimonadaceae bacterium]|nr:magnesium transporter [Fimbriimonadaceae bacterium]
MRTEDETFIDRLRSLARVASPEVVGAELQDFLVEDIAEGLSRLETEEAVAILQNLDPEVAANVLVEVPTETARRTLAALPDETVAFYLDVLPMDDAVDLREELPPERFEALLEVIPAEDAQEIRRLMSYPEDSAGQLMTEAFFEVGPDDKMSQILEDIRLAPEGKYETVNDIYVLDRDRHLLGVFSLRLALRAEPESTAREVMRKDVVTCSAWTPAEEVARQISRYGFYAMPVLDHRGRMLGIFTVDDAQEIIEEADTEDLLMLGGVSGDAEAYLSLNVIQLIKRRLPWLLILFVAESFTGAVMRHYDPSPAQTLAGSSPIEVFARLSLFLPLLIGAGGNTGSQVTTTITRALGVGEVRPGDVMTIIRREFATALVIGAVLGILGFIRAWIGWDETLQVCTVVGLALPAIVIWAATIGSMLPLAAKRVGVDPAVMSAPFISTFVDATGLIIYFEIAHVILRGAF